VPKCDVWVCLHQKNNAKVVKDAVGSAFSVMRGEQFRQFIARYEKTQEKLGTKNQSMFYGEPSQTEASETSVPNGTSFGIDLTKYPQDQACDFEA